MEHQRDLTLPEQAANYQVMRHILQVQYLLLVILTELQKRMVEHDKSKMSDPEVRLFTDNSVVNLKQFEYWSVEYRKHLEKLKPALDHHYANNRHHPEHHPNGVDDMNLVDIVEMLCDWMASTKLMNGEGSIEHSLLKQQERFAISDQLINILRNTVDLLKGIDNANKDTSAA